MIKITIVACAMLFSGAAVAGQGGAFVPPPVSRSPYRSPSFFVEQYRRALVKLHAESLAYQAADGGTISVEHREEIQRKADRAHFDMVRNIRNNDRWSLDSRGVPISTRY